MRNVTHLHVLIVIVLLPLLAPATSGQALEMRGISREVVHELRARDIRKLLVVDEFDCRTGCSGSSFSLRTAFVEALARADSGLTLVSEPEISMLLKERGFLAIDRTHSLVQQVLAIRSAAMFVEGKIRQESIGWQLEIQLIEPKEDEVLWKKDFRLEEPPNLDVRRDEVMRDPETGVYLSGRGGIGSPRCIKCPNPEFTKEAIDKHISGRFVCLLTVSERGEPISPIGLTTLGHGLDEQAMEAIRKWKFQPAKDNQGKSVPVRVTIEVTFKQFG